MKSMTGYAYRELSGENASVSVEIKSYNSRFLDLSIYLPSWLSSLESSFRAYLSSRFARGKIDVNIRVKEQKTSIAVKVNESAAESYVKAIRSLARTLDINDDLSLSMIFGLDGVIETETCRDAEKYRLLIEPVLFSAAEQFESERIREGTHTENDIMAHLDILEDETKKIGLRVPEIEVLIKENLRTRFAEILGNLIDENRLLAETAVLLVKYTISEELSRLSSHILEFRNETAKNPSAGKKLDFLSQEMNREINTIGSKIPMLEVSRGVVEMKNALENIREQLRNVE